MLWSGLCKFVLICCLAIFMNFPHVLSTLTSVSSLKVTQLTFVVFNFVMNCLNMILECLLVLRLILATWAFKSFLCPDAVHPPGMLLKVIRKGKALCTQFTFVTTLVSVMDSHGMIFQQAFPISRIITLIAGEFSLFDHIDMNFLLMFF